MFDRILNRDTVAESRDNQPDSNPHDDEERPGGEGERQTDHQDGDDASPYPITETSMDSVGDIEVRAQTVDEGVVAGADIRTMFEVTPGGGPPTLWLGYQKDPHRGFVEAGLPFNSLFRHLWVSGTTGYGKSTMLVNSMTQLANEGHGFVYVDPKGQDSRDLLRKLPEDRLDDVVWVEPGNLDREDTVGLNFLDIPSGDSAVSREEEIETRIETLKAVLSNGEYWGINMESITESMGRAMLQSDTQYSLIDMYYILLEADRREDFAETVEDRYLREFCEEIAAMPDKTIRPLLKRLKSWVESPVIRQIIAHKHSTIDFREIIDNDQIVIVRTPIENASVKQMISLGVMRQLWTAIRQRASSQDGQPDPYFLFCDEFDDIASPNLDLEGMLARARSNRLSVTLSCQYPSQLDSATQDAVRNNCDTTLAFSVNAKSDARILMERFQEYSAEDLLGTGRYQLWTQLPREDKSYSNPVRINTFPPYPPLRTTEAIDDIIDASLAEHGTRQLTDTEIQERLADSKPTTNTTVGSAITAELAAAVRAVQLRESVRSTNDWVDTTAVVEELGRRQSLIEDTLEYDEGDLPRVWRASSRLDVATEGAETSIRLTEEGERVVAPDTGEVQAAGSHKHDTALQQVEVELTALGFTVSILTQDGSEKPDARATHPDFAEAFAIEVETTTPGKPAKVLTNLRKAQQAGEIPLFVVQSDDKDTYWAERVAQTLNSPVRNLQSGETRFYTTDENVTFNGGATEEGGVTAVRPTSEGGSRNIWTRQSGDIVLKDADGTEYLRVESLSELSKGRLPAVYSYDAAAEEYVVYAHGNHHLYESKEAFTADWTRIKRPFIPQDVLPYPDYDDSQYAILILQNQTDSRIYRDDRTTSLASLPELDLSATSNVNPDGREGEGVRVGEDDGTGDRKQLGSENVSETTDWQDDPDTVMESFASEYLREVSDGAVQSDRMYEVYESWAEEQEVSPVSKRWFARRLSNYVDFESTVKRQDGSSTRYYDGLELITTN